MKDNKITNMIFNDWVNEYKNKSLFVVEKPNAIESKSEPNNDPIEVEEITSLPLRKFSPIILTKNY